MPLSLKGAVKMANTWTTLLDAVYPIGSVYSAYTSTSPATRFGGTWSAITGKFPYYNAGTGTGGSNTHTLTIEEMPSHAHSLFAFPNTGGGNKSDICMNVATKDNWGYWFYNDECQKSGTVGTGGDSAHNNMPAYQTLYAWRRTA